ncbi:MAG: SprT-like domain-containing protein [Prevotella sp.]|nr:SprT-like domain-containing protein [Prevotella sp.]
MQVDVETLKLWFEDFNKRYFSEELPLPNFATGKSRTRLGSLSWRVNSRLFFKSTRDYTLRVSNFYDMKEKDFKNVLLHEMIHLYIVSKGIKDSSPHGERFISTMRRINSYGWNVQVSTKIGNDVKKVRINKMGLRVVLAAITKEDKHLLSVVNPRYVRKVDTILRRSHNVRTFSWYLSENEYFENFPLVRTPRGRIVKKNIYDMVVEGAKPLPQL